MSFSLAVINTPANAGDISLEKEKATLSIVAWKIPRTEKPGGLQPILSQRVR